uniref:GPI ethanolamine phosphate transferase 1 n=1 Tax=Ananas comosus var. bracteatus TaxID=296719 RepID=A0A6V7P387_ANACO|nr:unnamed protein product [Ananas comosus var. bracteatus]
MPAEIPDNNNLVIFSGALIIVIGMASRWVDSKTDKIKFGLYLSLANKKGIGYSCSSSFSRAIIYNGLVVHLTQGSEQGTPPDAPVNQLVHSWILPGSTTIFSPSILSRLTSIFLGFAPPFLLLSIGYEAVFYSAFALVLMGWILVECTYLYSSGERGSSLGYSEVGSADERCLQLSDLRIPLIFMVLFNVAFFGTGNFASIASFEISSVYRFITIFSPFLMAALLIFKLFIPFMLVICVFSAITKLVRVPRLGCYFLVILLSDVMTIHFFFLVRNTGSWMEIGNSISHFGIMSAQVVFVLMLFALTNIYTKDIEVSSRRLSSQKAL